MKQPEIRKWIPIGYLIAAAVLFLLGLFLFCKGDRMKNIETEAAFGEYQNETEHKIWQMVSALTKDSSPVIVLNEAEDTLAAGSFLSGTEKTRTKPHGICILCRGGNDPSVRKELIIMLADTFGVGTNHIYIGGKPE